MFVDADIQVWLESSAPRTEIVTPYILSPVEKTLQYRLRAIKESSRGRSEISQSGTVTAPAKKALALGKMAMSIAPADTCRIELTLSESGVMFATYLLECPN